MILLFLGIILIWSTGFGLCQGRVLVPVNHGVFFLYLTICLLSGMPFTVNSGEPGHRGQRLYRSEGYCWAYNRQGFCHCRGCRFLHRCSSCSSSHYSMACQQFKSSHPGQNNEIDQHLDGYNSALAYRGGLHMVFI